MTSTATAASKSQKIVSQVEYYFGDINLPRDKFLQEEMKRDNGWVALSTMLKFNRLAALSTDIDDIAAALRDSHLIELSEDSQRIRRNPDVPLPPLALNTRVEYTFHKAGLDDKATLLKELLDKEAQEKDTADPKVRRTLVFARASSDCNMLALFLIENGFMAQTINSDRSQEERELAFSQFRKGEAPILVTTDEMARGCKADHVINFDLPYDMVTFFDRVQRAGRLVTSFVVESKDRLLIPELTALLQEAGREVPRFFLEDTVGFHLDW